MSSGVNKNMLGELQAEVVARLESDAYFVDVKVYAETAGLTGSELDRALKGLVSKGGKRGAAVVVELPSLAPDSDDVPGPQGDAEVVVQCYHRPTFNDASKGGTGKTADAIALTIVNVLHHYLPDGVAGVRGNFLAAPRGIRPIGAEADLVGYTCKLTVPVTVGRSARVARPVVTVAGGSVTATCATTGAAIWWTADGSYPGSGNPAATLYAGPMPEPTGVYLLRFGAEVGDESAIGSQTVAVGN